MKISQVIISNFRSYSNEVTIDFNDLTTFVGKNDIGKSTILEALDIFFNEGRGVVKIDKEDINKDCLKKGDVDIKITIIFTDLPKQIIIDDSNKTTLKDEFLLTSNNTLKISKIFQNAGKEKVSIIAYHPTNPDCNDLLYKKQSDLRKLIDNNQILTQDKNKNASMRQAIWKHFKAEQQLEEIEIDASKEEAKNIWIKIKEIMPLYSLFRSDRENADKDNEIQDPMKLAVQEILKDPETLTTLDQIALKTTEQLKIVAQNTCEKLREMNPEIANSLNPVIPTSENLKWADVFKSVSISSDDNIPLNKRGSGVKRLILLNFFRAEAERRKKEKNIPDIIYAIEEPETSQHPDHQKKLIDALIKLSEAINTQIILTTHSPALVKMLQFNHLKLIKKTGNKKEIVNVEESELPYPSLNEVNFLAFDEASEEYHDELYGHLDQKNWLDDYKKSHSKIKYKKILPDGESKEIDICLNEYIRHQIHHPENKHNNRFSKCELNQSIADMRKFIINKKAQKT